MSCRFRPRNSVFLILLGSLSAAWGDPGAVVWSGGTIRLMKEHPSVRLVSEKIILEPDVADARITVLLEFENRGKAASVAMGFPIIPRNGHGYYFVRGFNVESNGKPIEVTRQKGLIRAPREQSKKGKKGLWYLFNVDFGANSGQSMRIRYRQSCSVTRYDAGVQIPYILFTGGTWKGPIDRVEVEVRLSDRRNFSFLSVHAGTSSRPTPRPRQLEYEVRGNTLLWKAVKYTGDPDIFWFTGRRGPAYVAVDDERRVAGHDRIRWHHGQLLVEAEFLADLLGAQVKPTLNIQYFATLEREGTKVPMEGTLLRTLGDGAADEPPYRLFLNPRPALAAFDSTVRVGTDRRGDAKVRFACFQSGPKTAMASALAVGQKLAYRLRCLNTIAQRWPEHAIPLCRTICTRSKEKPELILWAVGHCAGQQVPQAAPEAVIPRLTETSEGRVETVAEIALSTNDDSILRGAALVLARLDAAAARDYLISHISKGANWQHGSRRGRNSGLALRIMRCSDACERLVSAVESYNGRQPAEDALYALGFLGDDKAIDFLVKTALDPKYKGDVAGVATRALGHLRTAAALNACADLIDRSGDPKIISRARGVLVVATGYYRPPSRLVPPAPAWATALSDSDACRSALPHLERLAKAPKKHGDFTQFLAYVREKLAE